MSHEDQNMSSVSGQLAVPAPESAAPETRRPRGFLAWPEMWGLMITLAAVAAMVMLALGEKSGYFIRALGVAIVLVAAWHDSATERMPNKLTYPAVLIGLFLNFMASASVMMGWALAARWLGITVENPMTESALGFAICAGIGIVSMLLGGIGGGDMKLIAAMGAIFGLHLCCLMLLWALLVAIPLAIINLVFDRRVTIFFKFVALQLMTLLWMKRLDPTIDVSGSRRMPIALPLAMGTILALALPDKTLPGWLTGAM